MIYSLAEIQNWLEKNRGCLSIVYVNQSVLPSHIAYAIGQCEHIKMVYPPFSDTGRSELQEPLSKSRECVEKRNDNWQYLVNTSINLRDYSFDICSFFNSTYLMLFVHVRKSHLSRKKHVKTLSDFAVIRWLRDFEVMWHLTRLSYCQSQNKNVDQRRRWKRE